jgi:hypothetical protein
MEEIVPIQDGFGFRPDGGQFEIRNNTAYWEDGDITENFNTAWVRWMRATNGKEHYADWTDEKRAAVKTERDGKIQAADAALKDIVLMAVKHEEFEIIVNALQQWAIHLNMLPGDHREEQAKISNVLQYLGREGEAQ